ncbi:MAG: hypothetical protein ACXV3T_05640 [Halobacteriota archaeon]
MKTCKAVKSRAITKEDIENVVAYIRRAEISGEISKRRALQYIAYVLFGAYTGQRSMSTMSRLTVGQFREALENNKPVLLVTAEQDKIRMEHYVPLHPCVVNAVRSLLDGRKETEPMFKHRRFCE